MDQSDVRINPGGRAGAREADGFPLARLRQGVPACNSCPPVIRDGRP